MQEPILSPYSKKQLQHYLKRPGHALLLGGQDGIGKYYVARWVGEQLGQPTITVETIDNKAISIAQIRELYTRTRTGDPLLVIVRDAHTMSREAQNAFLKLLEEPPKHVKFILTTQNSQSMLPTIVSRTTYVNLTPPHKDDLVAYVHSLNAHDKTELARLAVTTENLPGKLITSTKDDESKQLHQALVAEAKRFYSSPVYERLCTLVDQNYSKEWFSDLSAFLVVIVDSLMRQQTDPKALKTLTRQARLLQETHHNLYTINGNQKIHLIRLAVQL